MTKKRNVKSFETTPLSILAFKERMNKNVRIQNVLTSRNDVTTVSGGDEPPFLS